MTEFTNISPLELAKALAESCLTESQKNNVLSKLNSLSAKRVEALYASLIELKRAENEFSTDKQKTDLKFRLMFINELEKAKNIEKKQ